MYNVSLEMWLAMIAALGIGISVSTLAWLRVMRTAWYKRLTDEQRMELLMIVTLIVSVVMIVLIVVRQRGG